MSSERLWQLLSVGLLLLWLFTFAFLSLRSSLIEGHYLTVIRGEVVSAVQQLNTQQQALAQRVQALEQGRKGD